MEGKGVLDNNSVLITGGTGSFGKKFVARVLKENQKEAITEGAGV